MKLTDRKGIYYKPSKRFATGTKPVDFGDDWVYFSSTLEFKVFRDCCDTFGHHRVISQVPIVIFPACNTFGELKWKVDIGVLKDAPNLATGMDFIPPCNLDLLIEVKGAWVAGNGYKGEFLRTLMMCEQNEPKYFEKLLLWGEKHMKITRKIAINSYSDSLKYIRQLAASNR